MSTAEVRSEAGARQYLTFHLGTELFGVGILDVKEIIEYSTLTQVPMMPPCVRGVINLRGAVVPVIDLAVRFGREAHAVGRRTCIIIVETVINGERHNVGAVVDAVNAVLDIASTDIEPAPSFGARIRNEFIQGIGKVDGRFVILVDVNAALAPEDVVGQMASAALEQAA